MGRRHRKRSEPPARPAGASASGRSTGAARRGDERPKPPWHPVPLVELAVLVGLVLCVLGLLDLESDRGKVLLVFGLALGSLGGLDTVLREHFSGYRSHSTVLAGLPAVLAAGALFFARVPWPVVAGAAALVFAGTLLLARNAFRRRSGGRSFRLTA